MNQKQANPEGGNCHSSVSPDGTPEIIIDRPVGIWNANSPILPLVNKITSTTDVSVLAEKLQQTYGGEPWIAYGAFDEGDGAIRYQLARLSEKSLERIRPVILSQVLLES